jgi:hypothetical protein
MPDSGEWQTVAQMPLAGAKPAGGQFNTQLSPMEEQNFTQWKAQYAPNDSGEDYDLRGAFKANLRPDPKTGHWPDTYKKPNHPTFSNESQYAKFGKPGHWEGDRFIPAKQGSDDWETIAIAQPGPGQRFREASGEKVADLAEAVGDKPLEAIPGAAEGLAAGAVGVASAAVGGIGGLAGMATGQGFAAGSQKAKDVTGMTQLEKDIAPTTEAGKKFLDVLGLIPDAIHAGGEKVFEALGGDTGRQTEFEQAASSFVAAGTEGIASALAVKPTAVKDVGKLAGWAFGKGSEGKGGPGGGPDTKGSAAFREAFDDLAREHPNQARDIVAEIPGHEARMRAEDRIDEVTVERSEKAERARERAKKRGKEEPTDVEFEDLARKPKVATPPSPKVLEDSSKAVQRAQAKRDDIALWEDTYRKYRDAIGNRDSMSLEAIEDLHAKAIAAEEHAWRKENTEEPKVQTEPGLKDERKEPTLKQAESQPDVEKQMQATQLGKQVTKKLLNEELTAGRVTPEHSFRGTTTKELEKVAKTGELVIGQDAEGRPGISASTIGDGQFPVYGDGTGIIIPPEVATPSGRQGETLVEEKTDPKKLKYVVEGKVISFDEMKAKLSPEKKPETIDYGKVINKLEAHLAGASRGTQRFTPEQASANVRTAVQNAGERLDHTGAFGEVLRPRPLGQMAAAMNQAQGASQIVYMYAGIPVTKADLVRAFALARSILQKSDTYRAVERNLIDSYDWLIRSVAPESMSNLSRNAAAVLAKNIAEQMRSETVMKHRGEPRREFWNRLGPKAGLEFMHNYEKGGPFPDEVTKAAARGYSAAYADLARQDKELGLEYDEITHYLPHMFEDQAGVARWLQQRYGPKWGDPNFIKDRSFDMYEQAQAAGFRPKFTNPEDLFQARHHASAVAKMQIQALRELERHGMARRVVKGIERSKDPDHYELEWRAPNGERYLVPNDIHQLMTNAFNSPSLWSARNPAGAVFRGAMDLKNKLVPIKLALSLFHPLHIATIDNATTMVRATKGLLSGAITPGRFVREMAQGLFYKELVGETVGALNKQGMGYRLLNAYRGKIKDNDLTDADRLALQYMGEGGFTPEMPKEYKNNAIAKFKDALQQHSVKAVFKAPWAMVEALQKPIFEEWIPMLKTASYIRDAKRALEADPSLLDNPLKRMAAFRQLQKSVDNRYGEMAYNTLFWNRYLRDIGVGSTLSMGWNLGFIREYGGGVAQVAKAGIDMTNLKEGDSVARHIKEAAATGELDKAMFVGYYVMSAMALGGLMTWYMSGQAPQEANDYIYPKTGETGPDGKPERVNTMFYTREFAAIQKHVQHEGLVSGIGKIVSNKVVPLVDEAKTLWTNVDYFGREISDPDSNAFKQLAQKLEWFMADQIPISMQGAKQGRSSAKQVGLAVAGFSPAPKYATESDAEAKIVGIYQSYHKSTTPYDQAQRGSEAIKLRKMAQSGDEGYEQAFEQFSAKHELSSADQKRMRGDVGLDSYKRMFKALRSSEQIKVIKEMTPEEREAFTPFMHKKTKEAIDQ